MVKSLLTVAVMVAAAAMVDAHDSYSGKCPEFPAMAGFDWNKFTGRWYATEKFDTSQSKCLTYTFGEDEDGFRFVEQKATLGLIRLLSLDNKYHYKGRLAAPSTANPAAMIVRFPLNLLGSASWVVMDTDYSRTALVCTCQSQNLLSLWTIHRRSCTILQREPILDKEASTRLKKLLDDSVKVPGEDDVPSHDFDLIDHSNCNYADNEKGLKIDVDKILGIDKDTVAEEAAAAADNKNGSSNNNSNSNEFEITRAVDTVAAGGFRNDTEAFDPDAEEVVLSNLPLKQQNPRV